MVDISLYRVGVVTSVEDLAKKGGGKALRKCTVDVGFDGPIAIVTSAANVREGSRVVVAPAGTVVVNEEGEEMEVQRTAVGGVQSEGMLCDSRMLGWSGGAVGLAVQVPESIAIGEAPPADKPRTKDSSEPVVVGVAAPGLYEKKLTKEEKKKLAEERRLSRKVAKAAKKVQEDNS